MRKPPKMRPWMLRTCGWHTKVLCWQVCGISTASLAANAGSSCSRRAAATHARASGGTA